VEQMIEQGPQTDEYHKAGADKCEKLTSSHFSFEEALETISIHLL
jgi:hypothetical protein